MSMDPSGIARVGAASIPLHLADRGTDTMQERLTLPTPPVFPASLPKSIWLSNSYYRTRRSRRSEDTGREIPLEAIENHPMGQDLRGS